MQCVDNNYNKQIFLSLFKQFQNAITGFFSRNKKKNRKTRILYFQTKNLYIIRTTKFRVPKMDDDDTDNRSMIYRRNDDIRVVARLRDHLNDATTRCNKKRRTFHESIDLRHKRKLFPSKKYKFSQIICY